MVNRGESMRNHLTNAAVLVLLAAAFNPLTCTVRPADTTVSVAEPVVEAVIEVVVEPPAIAEVVEFTVVEGPSDPPLEPERPIPPRPDVPMDVVVVQDITGSFQTGIHHARAAVLQLVDAAEGWPAGSRLGMSTFVGGVAPEPWTPLTPVTDLVGVRSQWRELDICNCDIERVFGGQRLCSRGYGGFDKRPQMQSCFEYGAQSHPAAGLRQAISMLEEHPESRKIVVLVIGGPACCGDKAEQRSLETQELSAQIGEAGWDLWVVGAGVHDPEHLESLRQNLGDTVILDAENALDTMERVIRSL